MSIRPSMEMGIAACTVVISIVAVIWWALSDVPVAIADTPTWSGKAVEQVSAAVPAIGPFEREFHVNDLDPFVNEDLRPVEENRIRTNQHWPHGQRNPENPTQVKTPPPAVPPTLVWPAAVGHLVGPSCVGVITTTQGSLLLVKMPSSDELVAMSVGDTVPKDAPADKQWQLQEVEDGAARFKDPTGSEMTLPIGQAPVDPPPKPPEDPKKPDANGRGVINTPNGTIQLPPGWGNGPLRLPPNWQQNMTPEMQRQIQQQIMRQMFRSRNSDEGGGK
jgi:hypothetical protein